MLITLRKFTIIFLATLQLFAPLVHAHVGEKIGLLPNPGFGTLHVPGLEKYSVDRDAAISPEEMSHCNVSTHDSSFDDMLIGIDTGIKDKQANAGGDLDSSCYLHQQAAIFKTAISPFDINFSPQTQLFVSRLFIPSLSPRAPPAQ
jgi:hypothetical protein